MIGGGGRREKVERWREVQELSVSLGSIHFPPSPLMNELAVRYSSLPVEAVATLLAET